jgi:hypothetical protein
LLEIASACAASHLPSPDPCMLSSRLPVCFLSWPSPNNATWGTTDDGMGGQQRLTAGSSRSIFLSSPKVRGQNHLAEDPRITWATGETCMSFDSGDATVASRSETCVPRQQCRAMPGDFTSIFCIIFLAWPCRKMAGIRSWLIFHSFWNILALDN